MAIATADSVFLPTINGGSGWMRIVDEVIGIENYRRYIQDSAMLLVDAGITLSISG